jgi:hypothetical protein
MRFPLLIVATLFVPVVAVAQGAYRFTINGKAHKAQMVSLDGNNAVYRAGDVAWAAGFVFVLDEPGVYHLQQLAGDSDRLWRVGEGGNRTLLACRASSGESGKKKRTNPLAELNDEQLLQLRSVDLEWWPDGIERLLGKLDLTKCLVTCPGEMPAGGKQKPPLPAGIRYLSIR